MRDVLAAMPTKFLQLQTLWFLFFVFSTAVIDAIARGALKMDDFAH